MNGFMPAANSSLSPGFSLAISLVSIAFGAFAIYALISEKILFFATAPVTPIPPNNQPTA